VSPRTGGRAAFDGYPRSDRPPGTRNRVLVMPSVICSALVAESIAERVPGAVGAPHDHGCGQIGGDREQTRRTLLNVCENPNVAGVVMVGLGCETLSSEELAGDLSVPVRQTAIQATGGTEATIEAGARAARELAGTAAGGRREQVGTDEFTLGVAVGDLADSTLESVYPAVARLVERVVEGSGRSVVAGVEPLVPHADRADELATEEATEPLRAVLERRRDTGPPSAERRKAAGESPGTLSGLWSGEPIVEVLEYGERARSESGVSVVDAPGRFEEAATGLAAAGAQLIVHGTADGVPTGHPVVPVCKVTGDPETAAALSGDTDVDAAVAEPDRLADRAFEAAGGDPTAAENHGLAPFAITRSGPSL